MSEDITHGMRERATDMVSLDLGPRSEWEIEKDLRRQVDQERFTRLDRRLLEQADETGVLQLRMDGEGRDARFMHAYQTGRLQKLKRMGLAKEETPGVWRLAPNIPQVLQRVGEEQDIVSAMHRAMAREGQSRSASEYAIYDPADPRADRLVGRVVERGLVDDFGERHYVIIDGIDGRVHFVDIGRAEAVGPLPDSGIVAIDPRRPGLRVADRTIVEIATANEGRYSVEIHLTHDPTSTSRFAEAHVRRLEALRRADLVAREPDGTWNIPSDYLDRAARFERAVSRANPVTIEVLSPYPLDRLVKTDGATWLDRELVSTAPSGVRDQGFGHEVNTALAQRRQWLIEQGLAEPHEGQVVYRRNLLAILRRRELNRAAAQISGELGIPYAEALEGQRIEGTYRRRVDLASGRFALIERAHEFTLVPWRDVLERHIGKSVGGIVRGDTISWTIGRQRGRSISV